MHHIQLTMVVQFPDGREEYERIVINTSAITTVQPHADPITERKSRAAVTVIGEEVPIIVSESFDDIITKL